MITLKRIAITTFVIAITGCSIWKPKEAPKPPPAKPSAETQAAADEKARRKAEFHLGRSSYVVTLMAKQVGCINDVGSAMTSPAGPIETYKMYCDNGQVFQAKCELRQCVQIKE